MRQINCRIIFCLSQPMGRIQSCPSISLPPPLSAWPPPPPSLRRLFQRSSFLVMEQPMPLRSSSLALYGAGGTTFWFWALIPRTRMLRRSPLSTAQHTRHAITPSHHTRHPHHCQRRSTRDVEEGRGTPRGRQIIPSCVCLLRRETSMGPQGFPCPLLSDTRWLLCHAMPRSLYTAQALLFLFSR